MDGPTWAMGCYACSYGLLQAPSLARDSPSYYARLGHFQRGELTFCDCQAGQAYYKYLEKLRSELIELAKQDPMMAQAAAKGTHPELEGSYGWRQRGYWGEDSE